MAGEFDPKFVALLAASKRAANHEASFTAFVNGLADIFIQNKSDPIQIQAIGEAVKSQSGAFATNMFFFKGNIDHAKKYTAHTIDGQPMQVSFAADGGVKLIPNPTVPYVAPPGGAAPLTGTGIVPLLAPVPRVALTPAQKAEYDKHLKAAGTPKMRPAASTDSKLAPAPQPQNVGVSNAPGPAANVHIPGTPMPFVNVPDDNTSSPNQRAKPVPLNYT